MFIHINVGFFITLSDSLMQSLVIQVVAGVLIFVITERLRK